MTRAFVLGNGISRQGVDLTQLKQLGKIYGCNALYREFIPDVLVATDRPISEQIQESSYALANEFYTRKPIAGSGARHLPKDYYGYSSGPNALGLAASHGNLQIFMLGFDMGPTPSNLFNNVYADTEFYKTSAHPPTFTGNWVRQIAHVCRDYPATEFVRLCGTTTASIADLNRIPNLKHQDLKEFLDIICT
jgi:hypothetical protein